MGTPKNGATWEWTPTDAGWATGARTWPLVAALTSPWSARGASWRRRRLWLTALRDNSSPTLDQALDSPPMVPTIMAQALDLDSSPIDPPLTVAPSMALTMA